MLLCIRAIFLQRMKLISYIFSFYLIVLSVVPCCSFDDSGNEITEQGINHENQEEDCGGCSPFFSCEGCAAATVTVEAVRFEIIPAQCIIVYTGYIQNSLPGIDYDFWQPPKIV
jgi:hypothetical protein